jgi:hypothetical protein
MLTPQCLRSVTIKKKVDGNKEIDGFIDESKR